MRATPSSLTSARKIFQALRVRVSGSILPRGAGGRGGASNQYVLLGSDLGELRQWTLALEDKLRTVTAVTDVTSDQDRTAPQANVVIDREAAIRMGVSVAAIDNALNNAFAQRQISIIYAQRNQYRVVEEVDPKLQTDPTAPPQAGSTLPVGGVFAKNLPSGVTSVQASATAPDGSVYVLADASGTIGTTPVPGTQGVALLKYDPSGKLLYTKVR